MVKAIQIYKFTSKSMTSTIMAILNVYLIFAYARRLVGSMGAPYYVGRTRVDITYERDFETITENRVQYFLYLNKTEGALDADNAQVGTVMT